MEKLIAYKTFISLVFGLLLGLSAPPAYKYLTRDEAKTFATFNGGSVQGSEVMKELEPFLESEERQIYRMKKRKTEELIRAKLGALRPQDIKPEELEKVQLAAGEFEDFIKNRFRNGRKASPEELKQIESNLKMRKLRVELEQKNQSILENANIQYTIPNTPADEIPNAGASENR
ncbi:MAG: hypothetical protein ACK5V3_03515 [Bdellovibrionales bacterium]